MPAAKVQSSKDPPLQTQAPEFQMSSSPSATRLLLIDSAIDSMQFAINIALVANRGVEARGGSAQEARAKIRCLQPVELARL